MNPQIENNIEQQLIIELSRMQKAIDVIEKSKDNLIKYEFLFKKFEEKATNLHESNDKMQAEINQVRSYFENALITHQSYLSVTNEQVSYINKELKTLKPLMNSINESINRITAKIDYNESNLNKQKNKIDDYKKKIEDLSHDYLRLAARVPLINIQQKFACVEQEIAGLEDRIGIQTKRSTSLFSITLSIILTLFLLLSVFIFLK